MHSLFRLALTARQSLLFKHQQHPVTSTDSGEYIVTLFVNFPTPLQKTLILLSGGERGIRTPDTAFDRITV
jgi:hypothetical protein